MKHSSLLITIVTSMSLIGCNDSSDNTTNPKALSGIRYAGDVFSEADYAEPFDQLEAATSVQIDTVTLDSEGHLQVCVSYIDECSGSSFDLVAASGFQSEPTTSLNMKLVQEASTQSCVDDQYQCLPFELSTLHARYFADQGTLNGSVELALESYETSVTYDLSNQYTQGDFKYGIFDAYCSAAGTPIVVVKLTEEPENATYEATDWNEDYLSGEWESQPTKPLSTPFFATGSVASMVEGPYANGVKHQHEPTSDISGALSIQVTDTNDSELAGVYFWESGGATVVGDFLLNNKLENGFSKVCSSSE